MHDDANTHLEQLACELERCGWRAELSGDGWLVVTNPKAGDMSELINCREQDACGSEFCWSWGDSVGSVASVADAADRIVRVLRVVGVNGPAGDS
jgi:hypothetical protein